MAGIAVIALAIVFHHQLPVRRFDQIVLHRDLEAVELVDADLLGNVRLYAVDRRRIVGKAEEDQAGDVLDRDRAQAVGRLVEFLGHVARGEQLAVERESPLVIGAGDAGVAAVGGIAQLGTAVRTGVVESADLAIAAAHDDH